MPSQTVASFSQLEPHRTRTTLRPGSQYQPMWKPRRETLAMTCELVRKQPSRYYHPGPPLYSLDTRKQRTMWQHRQDTVSPKETENCREPLLLIRDHVETSRRQRTSLSENQREPFSLFIFSSCLFPLFHLSILLHPPAQLFRSLSHSNPPTPTNPSRY